MKMGMVEAPASVIFIRCLASCFFPFQSFPLFSNSFHSFFFRFSPWPDCLDSETM